jgi:hypothetical protein
MKPLTFTILVTVLFSCCKKGENDCNNMKTNLVSKWEIRESIGSIAGQVVLQKGNGSILEFKSDNEFNYYFNGNIVQSGTWLLKAASEKNHYTLTLQNNGNEKVGDVILTGNTLHIQYPVECCDIPYDFTYERID